MRSSALRVLCAVCVKSGLVSESRAVIEKTVAVGQGCQLPPLTLIKTGGRLSIPLFQAESMRNMLELTAFLWVIPHPPVCLL